MYFVGIDIGSSATKAAAVDGTGAILATAVIPMGTGTKGSTTALNELYAKANLSPEDCGNMIATGYGRNNFKAASTQLSEIICHAKGVKKVLPSVHTIIDIGGQDSKAIRVSPRGTIEQFVMNDKCAAGTGRFLELMCRVVDIGIDEMGAVSAQAHQTLDISNTCAVFAESEVISRLSEGHDIPDIIAGVHASVSRRVAGLVMRVGLAPDVALTGGVAKNSGIVTALSQELKVPLLLPPEPQLTGALGAALFAQERYQKEHGDSL